MSTSVSSRQAALERRFPHWTPRTLDQMLDVAAQEISERPFVIADDKTHSYRDMQTWSERIACGLADAGIRAGDHVAVVLANFPEFIAAKFGIARAGAVCIPV